MKLFRAQKVTGPIKLSQIDNAPYAWSVRCIRVFLKLTCFIGTGPAESDCSGPTGLAEHYAELAVKADRYDPAALVNKGNVLMARDEVDKAGELYREAIMSDASCVEALYNLALVYKRQQRYADALQCFGKLNVVLRNDATVCRIRSHFILLYCTFIAC